MNVLITAGPTCEPIDPVRFLGNHSSGKMGYALAEAARDAGHCVTILSGPVHLPPPAGIEMVHVTTAVEMRDEVLQRMSGCDLAIFAAAVCDYRPSTVAPHKLKKTGAPLVLELVENPDILAEAGALPGRGMLVGFAAETGNVLENARVKLARKRCDAIVANDVSLPGGGFGSDRNAATLLFADGREIHYPLQSKVALARNLLRDLTAPRGQ